MESRVSANIASRSIIQMPADQRVSLLDDWNGDGIAAPDREPDDKSQS
jgi:hypothetical protein